MQCWFPEFGAAPPSSTSHRSSHTKNMCSNMSKCSFLGGGTGISLLRTWQSKGSSAYCAPQTGMMFHVVSHLIYVGSPTISEPNLLGSQRSRESWWSKFWIKTFTKWSTFSHQFSHMDRLPPDTSITAVCFHTLHTKLPLPIGHLKYGFCELLHTGWSMVINPKYTEEKPAQTGCGAKLVKG
jgi:hypothetical protein